MLKIGFGRQFCLLKVPGGGFCVMKTSCLLQCCTDNPEIVMMNVKEYFCIRSANQAVKVLAISKG